MHGRSALTSASSPLVIGLLALASACGGDPAATPTALFDGTPAAPARVAFEGVDSPTILSGVVVGAPAERRRRSCLDDWSGGPWSRSVVRVTVHGESVTALAHSGRAVLACDNGAGPREAGRRWCGGVYGVLQRGSLTDPRLDLLCSATGHPLAFAWVVPAARAHFVVVRHTGWAEAYRVVGSLPVRISATTAIDPDAGTASFDVSEHDASGTLVRRYTLAARVAG